MINELPDESIIICNPINKTCIIELNTINNDKIECPICFENIEDNDGILIMECCYNKIHLRCLVNWYTNNPNNLVCIMCNQNNSFCDNLVYDENIIQIPDSPNRSNNIPNWLRNNSFHYIILSIIAVSSIMLIITILFATVK